MKLVRLAFSPILRDAVLRTAPQDEGVVVMMERSRKEKARPHPEEGPRLRSKGGTVAKDRQSAHRQQVAL